MKTNKDMVVSDPAPFGLRPLMSINIKVMYL